MTAMLLDEEQKIMEYEEALLKLTRANVEANDSIRDEIARLQETLGQLREDAYKNMSAWERVLICRHQDRPKGLDYIRNLFTTFEELHGDRLYRDDPAMVTGLGTIDDMRFVVIAQEKGCDTESRLHRNFGMPHPEGYRKAIRMMELAEKFSLPVICFIDTPGAFPGLSAEERCQGRAIAYNLWRMASLRVPLIGVLIGEGCSGGALGIGVVDTLGMLEHAYYSVISPEGCASILFKDASKKESASEMLKMHAEFLLENRMIDEIIKEPLGGAHRNPDLVYHNVKRFILKEAVRLSKLSSEFLLDCR